MSGGLEKMSRYLLAGASLIGVLAYGVPEAQGAGSQGRSKPNR